MSPINKSDPKSSKSDQNQTKFSIKIRPKSDQNSIKIRPNELKFLRLPYFLFLVSPKSKIYDLTISLKSKAEQVGLITKSELGSWTVNFPQYTRFLITFLSSRLLQLLEIYTRRRRLSSGCGKIYRLPRPSLYYARSRAYLVNRKVPQWAFFRLLAVEK